VLGKPPHGRRIPHTLLGHPPVGRNAEQQVEVTRLEGDLLAGQRRDRDVRGRRGERRPAAQEPSDIDARLIRAAEQQVLRASDRRQFYDGSKS